MMMPGFSAETSLYRSSLAYYQLAIAAGSGHQAVRPALDSCTCTSPNCTWSCPPPPPPECAGLTGCALKRCECTLDPTCEIRHSAAPPCFFQCFCK
jgi:hypothetical protein